MYLELKINIENSYLFLNLWLNLGVAISLNPVSKFLYAILDILILYLIYKPSHKITEETTTARFIEKKIPMKSDQSIERNKTYNKMTLVA